MTLPIAPVSIGSYDANTRNMSLSQLFPGSEDLVGDISEFVS